MLAPYTSPKLRRAIFAATTSWYLFDGAHSDALVPMFQARHELQCSNRDGAGSTFPPEWRLLDYAMGARCGAHIASSGFQKGVDPFCSDDLLKDVFLGIEALKLSSTALLTYVDLHIGQHLSFDVSEPDAFLETMKAYS